jgi:predicted RNA-binding protein
MCESTAYLKDKQGQEKVLLEDVARVAPQADGQLLLSSILGRQIEVNGVIEEIDLMSHRIVLREA